MTETNRETIDAVITWVDGHDPVHRKKLADYLAGLGIERPESASPTRFNQCGELGYCIKSIRRFAPWINTIYVVTDSQTPLFMADFPRENLKFIDHRDIFTGFEHCLPTFNSLSIESVLWRIPGLTERFIYFNDDSFLIRPVTPEDFFQEDKLVLRGYWKVQSQHTWKRHLKTWLPMLSALPWFADRVNEHRNLQENSAILAGWHKHFFHQPHNPFPVRKSLIQRFFHENPALLANNVRFPLRNKEQFWSISLIHHLAMQDNKVIINKHPGAIMINAAYHSLKKIHYRLRLADKNAKIAFVCMQSLDAAPPEVQSDLLNWLNKSRSGDTHGLLA